MKLQPAHVLLTRYSQLRRRRRYPALLAIAVALVLLAYVLGFSDQQGRQNELASNIAKAAQTRAEKQAFLNDAKTYAERLRGLQEALHAAHAVLPDNSEVPQFLAQLGTMAHDVGLLIERFEPRQERVDDVFAELAFGVQVRGTFHQITMFVAQIGAMERIVNVSNVSLVAPKVENAQIDGQLDVKIYRLLSEEQVARAADAAGKEQKGAR